MSARAPEPIKCRALFASSSYRDPTENGQRSAHAARHCGDSLFHQEDHVQVVLDRFAHRGRQTARRIGRRRRRRRRDTVPPAARRVHKFPEQNGGRGVRIPAAGARRLPVRGRRRASIFRLSNRRRRIRQRPSRAAVHDGRQALGHGGHGTGPEEQTSRQEPGEKEIRTGPDDYEHLRTGR